MSLILQLNPNPSDECSSSLNAAATCLDKMPNLVKLYPHLMQTIKQNSAATSHVTTTTSHAATTNFFKDNQSLAALFPSLLTVDGPKLPTSGNYFYLLFFHLTWVGIWTSNCSGDLNTDHLTIRNIWIPNFLKFRFRMVGLCDMY